jgi:nanoRNase/pAp phosphatase (c-di-AMP/oligoRNAs hydrolase)
MTWQRSEYQRLQPLLAEAQTCVLVTHVHPDADGVGSGVALLRFLRGRGLNVRFMITHELQLSLRFLSSDGEAELYDPATMATFVRDADLIFTLDNSSVERLGPLLPDVKASRATRICIDHHLVREEFWQVNLIDEGACATGQMILDCIDELGGSLDRETALAIYTAIWSDTGGFRFPKTSGDLHRLVGRLLDAGVKPHQVYQELNERNLPAATRLMAETLLRLQFAADGRVAWVSVPQELMAACGSGLEDPSSVLNHMLAIEGVEIGLLLREEANGQTKISLRSKPQHDVNALALVHGGGGHRNAAGAVTDMKLSDCTSRLVAEAEAVLA